MTEEVPEILNFIKSLELNAEGDKLFASQKYAQALEKYIEAAKSYNNITSHILDKAKIIPKNNKTESMIALSFYIQALLLNPTDRGSLIAACNIFSYLGQPKEANELCKKFPTPGEMEDPEYLFMRGDMENNLGNHTEALKCFESAKEMLPDDIYVLYNLGEVQKTLGDTEGARKCFCHIIAKESPSSPTPTKPSLAYCYALLGNQDARALEAFLKIQKASVSTPNINILIGIALALIQKKQYVDAQSYLNQAITLFPYNIRLLTAYGVAWDGLGQYQHALAYFDKVLEASPNYVEALTGKAKALIGLKKFNDAETFLKKASAICPMNLMVLKLQTQLQQKSMSEEPVIIEPPPKKLGQSEAKKIDKATSSKSESKRKRKRSPSSTTSPEEPTIVRSVARYSSSLSSTSLPFPQSEAQKNGGKMPFMASDPDLESKKKLQKSSSSSRISSSHAGSLQSSSSSFFVGATDQTLTLPPNQLRLQLSFNKSEAALLIESIGIASEKIYEKYTLVVLSLPKQAHVCIKKGSRDLSNVVGSITNSSLSFEQFRHLQQYLSNKTQPFPSTLIIKGSLDWDGWLKNTLKICKPTSEVAPTLTYSK